jgi:hypothetical protein
LTAAGHKSIFIRNDAVGSYKVKARNGGAPSVPQTQEMK